MTELLQQLSARFDYVVIDGPPMLVADAKVLALKADGTIVVFNAVKTNRGAAQRTVRELKEINANILGCTLVAVRSLKGGYFEEMFRSYRDYQKTQLAGAV
jgi:non-specific protein-tyrosine kinase